MTTRDDLARSLALLHRVAQLRYDPAVPSAHTSVRDGRLVVTLGRMYTEGDLAQRRYVVAHELAHIGRGDLAPSDRDPRRWNFASDACIHASLRPTLGEGPKGIVSLATLHEQFPATAGLDATRAQPLYDAMGDQPGDQPGQPGDQPGQPCGCEPLAPDASAADRAAVERGRAIVSRSAGTSAAGRPWRRTPPQAQETAAARLVRRLAERLHGVRGSVRVRARSWSRPGRVTCIPGTARIPRARICVLVDRSGSMASAHAAIDYLAGIPAEVVWIAWAERAQVVPSAEAPAEVGGGTILAPALTLAEGLRPDHIVIISDAELGDSPVAPATPATWIVVGRTKPPWGEAIYVA